ncbi:hypothetical protein PTKU64_10890 [Paraburkholderia terrae]|uniref:Uncharacterized protein n=1 Tax=Paraburkholderia terrae TaxID=311230 RepID=A0ABM7TGK7_9BURK|nr:hypothetical protein PTKU64_10890 [Paraburkholderia terrae]
MAMERQADDGVGRLIMEVDGTRKGNLRPADMSAARALHATRIVASDARVAPALHVSGMGRFFG